MALASLTSATMAMEISDGGDLSDGTNRLEGTPQSVLGLLEAWELRHRQDKPALRFDELTAPYMRMNGTLNGASESAPNSLRTPGNSQTIGNHITVHGTFDLNDPLNIRAKKGGRS